MSKVYITNASAKLIFKGLKKVNYRMPSRDEIIQDLEGDFSGFTRLEVDHKGGFGKYFNLRELKDFYKMKMIFKNLPTLMEDMKSNYETIKKYIDAENRRFTKTVKFPAYHNDAKCEWLNSDFENIELPRSVKDDATRDQMKEFVNTHKDSLSFETLIVRFQAEFQTTEVLKEVKLPNTDKDTFDNVKLDNKIELLFNTLESSLNSGENGSVNKTVRNIAYADTWKMSNICKNSLLSPEDVHEIKIFMQAKQELADMLFSFFREKYNKDLSFEGQLLDALGFRPCRGCAKESSMTIAA